MTCHGIAVVRAPDDKCVLRQAQLIESVEDRADSGVELEGLTIAPGPDTLPDRPITPPPGASMTESTVDPVAEGTTAQVAPGSPVERTTDRAGRLRLEVAPLEGGGTLHVRGASDDAVLVERYIPGKEVHVGVLNDEALGGIEVVPHNDIFDYQAKYTPGHADYHMPPRLSPERLRGVLTQALRAHQALGCAGASRVNMIVSDLGNEYILEVNTLPGLTTHSRSSRGATLGCCRTARRRNSALRRDVIVGSRGATRARRGLPSTSGGHGLVVVTTPNQRQHARNCCSGNHPRDAVSN